VHLADRWYPSSKTCSGCGVVKTKLRRSERLFRCDKCELVLDRDLSTPPDSSSRSAAARPPRVGWATVNEPDGNPRQTRTARNLHGKTHEVNAAPQGDGCLNRVDSRYSHFR
jgi:putative transposase